jgi:hypothetical protein
MRMVGLLAIVVLQNQGFHEGRRRAPSERLADRSRVAPSGILRDRWRALINIDHEGTPKTELQCRFLPIFNAETGTGKSNPLVPKPSRQGLVQKLLLYLGVRCAAFLGGRIYRDVSNDQ